MKKILSVLMLLFTAVFSYAQEDVFSAARNGDILALKNYKEQGRNLDTANTKGFTPLILAVYNNQPKVVEFLLNNNVSINAADLSGNTALMGAIFKGNDEMAIILLNNKVNVNQQNKNGATALIFAATFGRKVIAEKLIEKQADKEIKDGRGKTALDHAVMQENNDLINLLKQ